MSNDDIDRMLNDAGSHWRRSQPRPGPAGLAFATSRPRGRWLPVVAAAATVGVVTAALLLAGPAGGRAGQHVRPGGSSPAADVTPTAGPSSAAPVPTATPRRVPAGFAADDLSFVSESEGWALGHGALLHTTDGGASWATLAGRPGGATHLRFADGRLGFAWGDVTGREVFLVTHDGGSTFAPEPGSSTEALEPGATNTLRVLRDPSCSPPGCPYSVEVAGPRSASFRRASAPRLVGNAVHLARSGSEVYLLVLQNPVGGSSDAHPTFAVSHDAGATWSTRPDPCSPPNASEEWDATALSAAPGGVVGVLCRFRMAPHRDALVVSADAAGSFGPAVPAPSSPVGALALADASHVLFAALPDASREQVLLASADGGRSGRKVAAERQADGAVPAGFLAFTTPSVATWVGPDRTVAWRTSDGGATWRSLGFSTP